MALSLPLQPSLLTTPLSLPLHSSLLQLACHYTPPRYNSALLATTPFLATTPHYTLPCYSLPPHYNSALTLPCYNLPPHPSLLQLATTPFLATTPLSLPPHPSLLQLATTLFLATTPLSLHSCYPLLATTLLLPSPRYHTLATTTLAALSLPLHSRLQLRSPGYCTLVTLSWLLPSCRNPATRVRASGPRSSNRVKSPSLSRRAKNAI